MSDAAPESKIDDANLRLLRDLAQRSAVELYLIRRELFTGGEYRKEMIERAHGMLAVGGGKGAYSAGAEMIAQGKPVLALDLQLGSTVDDGEGAVALHREMASDPSRFFPSTYQDMRNRLGLLSLNRGINDAKTVTRVSTEMLAKELDAISVSDQSMNVSRRLVAVWQAMKTLPIIASAIKIVEWARCILPFS